MKGAVFLAVMGFSACSLLAQDADLFRVKSGETVEETIPVVQQYRYATFRNGNVSFYNGSTATARLNYNILLGEMQFIDITGDTLSLAEEHTIRYIRIGENTFYYDPRYGYVEVVAEYPAVRLGRQPSFLAVLKEKKSAYGQSTGVSSIRSYNSYATGNSRLQKLDPKGDVLVAKQVTYFLVDHNHRIHRASKSSLMKLFSHQKRAIGDYLKAEAIDFDQEEDLRQLLQFCSALDS